MEDLCVTFEEWYIGDGTYPPLRKGQNVNLSFYIQPYEKAFTNNKNLFFRKIKNSNYEFSGQIIRDYYDNDNRVIIVDVSDFRFYIELTDKQKKSLVGQYIIGQGQLLIDYYIWVENLHSYENAPDIFYNFTIDKIRKVRIPEKFINRHENGLSAPASLSPEDYDESDIEEIEDMNETNTDTSFFLLDLKSIKENIAKTFV